MNNIFDHIIDLDHNATTKPYSNVIREVCDCLTRYYGNPSSTSCPLGIVAHEKMENCRNTMGHLLGIKDPSKQLIFTSCATESNNLILRGRIANIKTNSFKPHVITTNFEHPSIKVTLDDLSERGDCDVTQLEVSKPYGLIDLNELKNAIKPNRTVLVAIILANNEIGVIQKSKQISNILRQFENIHIHYDCTQLVGRYKLNLEDMIMDSASFSAHKFNGPKGVGGLYIRDTSLIAATNTGGLQEQSMRSGTENVAGIAGMTIALKESLENIGQKIKDTEAKRNYLQNAFLESFPHHCKINGIPPPNDDDDRPEFCKRLFNTLSVSFDFIDNKRVVRQLRDKGICCNIGSACSKQKGSKTLKAIGLSEIEQQGTLRISLGFETTQKEIEKAFQIFYDILNQELNNHKLIQDMQQLQISYKNSKTRRIKKNKRKKT